MGNVFDQMAASNNQDQPAAQTPAPAAEAPNHGSSQGNVFDQMAQEHSDPSGQNGHGASGSWEPNDPQQARTKVGTMPHLSEVWEGVSEPLVPEDFRQKGLREYADSAPNTFSMDHPVIGGSIRGLAGAVNDTIETLRSFTSPLAIGTLGLGELAEGSGAGAKIAKAASRGIGVGFGAQGVHDAYEGVKAGDIHQTLNGLGQALLSMAAELKGTKLDTKGKTNPAPAGTEGGDRTVLRPTTQKTAGVEAPIAASQQPEPSILTKVLEKTTTPGKAADFQEEHTKPAARRQAVSVLSQAAEDKIGAHDALVNGEAAPEQISGSQTPGTFMTPDEIWQGMQRSAGKTYDKARSISKMELDQWQEERTKAEQEHKAAIDRHNQLVDANNAELGEGEAPMDRLEYNADDVNSRERPKTYDELKSDLDTARDRLGRNNPSDVREKAKTADVPKAEKALDDWFKDHEDAIDGSEYQSAKSLWADSERFKDIANNLRGKLAKGTMTGNDIRGLEAIVDGKAIKRRGAAGIGEFGRLLGPEATENLNTVAKLFDPLESTDPRSGMIRSWGGYVAKHVVATMMAPLFGIHYLGIEGLNGLNELFMNHVMFDPEFGSSFANVVNATKAAISAGSQVPSAIWQPFKAMVSQIAQKYADSKLGGEEGAVSAGGVKRAKVNPRAGAKPLSPNGSGDSSASQEAINREQSEKSQGVKRVVVDTRSGQERPLLGVDAVDYQAKPYESVEFRGGDRDGEVIDQGRSARKYQRKNSRPSPEALQIAAHEKNGGSTFDVAGNDLLGTNKYAVGQYPNRTEQLDALTPENLRDFKTRNSDVLSQPNHSVGTWKDPDSGKHVLDISKLYDDREAAVTAGKALNQKSIYHLGGEGEIKTGGDGEYKPQMVGSPEVAAADNVFFQMAKKELPEGSLSDWAQRATALKQAGGLEKSEITTRRPKAVGADMNNNPDQHSNWAAIQQADVDSPSGVTALGKTKMGYKEKLARTVETYPGMPDVEDPAAPKDSEKILNRFVNHVSSNLEWLHNQIDPSIREKTRQWYDAAHQVVNDKAQSYGYTREQGAGVVAALSPQNPWDNNLGLADRVMDVYKNRQNFPFSPEMEKTAAELRQVPTQSQAFKKMLRDINGKKLKDIKNDNPDVQAVQRALWVRLYDEAHGNPENDQYAPTGEVVGKSPDTRSWIGLDHLSKAVKILDDGSVDNINSVMGQGHKIRNFYNNIINPMSQSGHTTIDTHAVAAGLLYPVGAKDVQAVHNFGSTVAGTPGAPRNAATGLQGTYPLYTEAYQRTARKLGILPRELQSITWEGIKALMGDEKKTPELKNKVRDIWDEVSMGALTPEEARAKIKSAANGFSKPAWMSDEEWEKIGAEGEDTSFMGVDDNAGSGQQLTQTGWISPKGEMLPIGDQAHEDAAVTMGLSGNRRLNRASEHFDAAMERGYIRAKVGIGGHEAAFNSQTLDSSNQAVLEKAIKNLPPNIDTVRVEIMKPYKFAAGSPEEVMNKLQGGGHAPGFDPSFLGGKE